MRRYEITFTLPPDSPGSEFVRTMSIELEDVTLSNAVLAAFQKLKEASGDCAVVALLAVEVRGK